MPPPPRLYISVRLTLYVVFLNLPHAFPHSDCWRSLRDVWWDQLISHSLIFASLLSCNLPFYIDILTKKCTLHRWYGEMGLSQHSSPHQTLAWCGDLFWVRWAYLAFPTMQYAYNKYIGRSPGAVVKTGCIENRWWRIFPPFARKDPVFWGPTWPRGNVLTLQHACSRWSEKKFWILHFVYDQWSQKNVRLNILSNSIMNSLKVIYHPLYGMNNYVLIWGDWLSCELFRGSDDSQSPHIWG